MPKATILGFFKKLFTWSVQVLVLRIRSDAKICEISHIKGLQDRRFPSSIGAAGSVRSPDLQHLPADENEEITGFLA